MDRALSEQIENVRSLIEASDFASIDALLEPLHSADIAEIVDALDPRGQIAILKRLDTETAADVLADVDEQSGQALLLLMSDREVVDLLAEMSSDDAADMLSTLPPEISKRIEALLPREDREELRGLRAFGEETAGGIMEVEHAAVSSDATIQDAIDIVRATAEEIENLHKVYVVGRGGELLGYVNVLELITHGPHVPVIDIMETNVISVPVDMDQEEVANLFGKYDEFTLPVVDKDRRLVGRITVDDIIDVIEEEASQDIAHIAGTTEEELGETSVLRISRSRLPWLITSIFGQLIAAVIMSRHAASLRQLLVLAFFVPLIVGTAGAIGMQAAVVVVRELALGHIDVYRTGRRVIKELRVAMVNGIVLAIILFAVASLWQGDVQIGLLLSGSLLSVVFVAALVGSSVPLILVRRNIDPAIASGPFIAVCNDIIGLTIYLSLASLYLSRTP